MRDHGSKLRCVPANWNPLRGSRHQRNRRLCTARGSQAPREGAQSGGVDGDQAVWDRRGHVNGPCSCKSVAKAKGSATGTNRPDLIAGDAWLPHVHQRLHRRTRIRSHNDVHHPGGSLPLVPGRIRRASHRRVPQAQIVRNQQLRVRVPHGPTRPGHGVGTTHPQPWAA